MRKCTCLHLENDTFLQVVHIALWSKLISDLAS